MAFFEACNVAFAAFRPPTIISLYLWRVALPFTCDARVHRPSTRGSHERKLLRSRLRVELGTLYRREGIHQGQLRRKARSGTEGMGVARRIFNNP